jgi:hypothetical protein
MLLKGGFIRADVLYPAPWGEVVDFDIGVEGYNRSAVPKYPII